MCMCYSLYLNVPQQPVFSQVGILEDDWIIADLPLGVDLVGMRVSLGWGGGTERPNSPTPARPFSFCFPSPVCREPLLHHSSLPLKVPAPKELKLLNKSG